MTQPKNLYDILGVVQTATQDEIKRAYRKMAQIYHPDKAGNDTQAKERWDEISKAYEILSDPEKKSLYDRPARKRTFYRSSWRPPGGNSFSANSPSESKVRRPKGRAWQKPENGLNLDDLFSDAVDSTPKPKMHASNQQRAGEQSDGEDVFTEVEVDSLIAERGGTVPFEYRRNRRTDGLSIQNMLELFHLRVPPNTRDGEVLTVDKMGHAGLNGGRSGDLHCTVRLASKPEQYADNPSLQKTEKTQAKQVKTSSVSVDLEVPITFPEAVLGARISVDTPSGEVVISIPPRSSSGRKLRLRGRGKGGSDFIISLLIVVPKFLDQDSLDLIEEFANRNPISPR